MRVYSGEPLLSVDILIVGLRGEEITILNDDVSTVYAWGVSNTCVSAFQMPTMIFFIVIFS
jgi:hypothetical protein